MRRRIKIKIHEAEAQAQAERWQCRTCDAPTEENGNYCQYCRMYWEDVHAGLFDDWGK
jgi:hypothetical protein